jgi:hypothetical protein
VTRLSYGNIVTVACKGVPKHLSGRVGAEYICTSVKRMFDRLLGSGLLGLEAYSVR